MNKLEFQEFNDANGTPVAYHVVTEETAGEYVVDSGNGTANVRPGEVLVKTSRPDVYGVVPNEDALGKPSAFEPEPVTGNTEPEPDDDFEIGGKSDG